MNIFYDGVTAFLSAVGLAALLWSAAELFLRKPCPAIPGVTLVLSLRGEALSMEADVKALRRLQRTLPGARLFLQDCDMSPQALQRARLLSEGCAIPLLSSEDLLPPP